MKGWQSHRRHFAIFVTQAKLVRCDSPTLLKSLGQLLSQSRLFLKK